MKDSQVAMPGPSVTGAFNPWTIYPGTTMAIIETHPEPIIGPWAEGFVLARHMVISVPLGYDDQTGRMLFDNKRTPLGEQVYRFKNRSGPAADIIDTAVAFIRNRWPNRFDCVVWPPPSKARRRQPAAVLALGVAEGLGLTCQPQAIRKVALTEQLKNLPTYERAAILEQAIQPGPVSLEGRRVLIIDDLWQTGSTMRRVASVVRDTMKAADVCALAMTRTK